MDSPLFILKLEGNPLKRIPSRLIAVDLDDKAEFNCIHVEDEIYLKTSDGTHYKVIEFFENIEPTVDSIEEIADGLFIGWSEVDETVFRAEYFDAKKKHH